MNIREDFCILVLFLFIFSGCQSSKNIAAGPDLKPEIEKKAEETEPLKIESSEEKAVRLAEEFIKRNGYTEAAADKDGLSHETVEFYNNIDELLESRHNTLEPKAYGISYRGRASEDQGWTIVFRFSEKIRKESEKRPRSSLSGNTKLTGRAVTMNGNFENLLVEHKDFFLDKINKKF